MKNPSHEPKKKRTRPLEKLINLKTAFVIGFIGGSILTFTSYHKIIELNNLKHYSIAKNGALNPYNLKIERESINDTIKTYLVDTKINKRIEIYRNFRLGDINHRVNTLIGDQNDNQSLLGKYSNIKIKTEQIINNTYQNIIDFFENPKEKQ